MAAKEFFDLSGNIWPDLTKEEKELKIADISTRFDGLDWSQKDEALLKLNSYLTSCAIRISTIYEVARLKPKMKAHYANEKLTKKYICHYLRDNVCHREPEDCEGNWSKRQTFLDILTIREIYESVESSIQKCRTDLSKIETESHLTNQSVNKIFDG